MALWRCGRFHSLRRDTGCRAGQRGGDAAKSLRIPECGQYREYDGVGMGALGPLIPDDSPRASRVWRRVRGITVEVIALVLVTLVSPVLLIGGLAVDVALWSRRRKPWMAVRLLAMLWWF